MSDGGAAQRSNMFKKGDVLTHVNGTDVQRLKIHQVFVATNRVYPSSICCRLPESTFGINRDTSLRSNLSSSAPLAPWFRFRSSAPLLAWAPSRSS